MEAKKKVEKLLRYLKKWCANPNNDLRANWVRELRKSNQKQSKQALAVGSLQIWFWANWHAQHGLLAILNGDPSGWGLIELSFRYRLWRMRIDASMTQVAESALLLAHAIALNEREKTAWLADYQLNSLKNKSSNLWKFSKLGLFGLELWAKDTNSLLVLDTLCTLPEAPELGVYGDIIRCWDDDGQRLVDGICHACDYHLEQALAQAGYPEFAMSPYDLLPIDYLALRRVRDTIGLNTPLPEHPLLRYEFLNPPETWNIPTAYNDSEVIRFVEIAGIIE